MQESWIRNHFKTDLAKGPEMNKNPIYISNWDIMKAIKKMGKNKA